jgi:hypothetical protein
MNNSSIKTEVHMSYNIFSLLFLTSAPIITILFFHKQPIIGIFFVFVFILFIFYTIRRQDKKFVSTYSWVKADAVVKSKKIVKYGCMSMYRKLNTTNSSYKIEITYQYQFDGEIFTSNQYAMAYRGDTDCNFLYTLNEANKIMHAITKDKIITIYINPLNPKESIVMQGKSNRYGISYSILVTYLIFLIYFVYKIYFNH